MNTLDWVAAEGQSSREQGDLPQAALFGRALPTHFPLQRNGRPSTYDPSVQVSGVQKVVGGLLDDVRTIARGMQVLPELARILESIETKVDTLNDEVHRMRVAVEEMGGDVKTVPTRLDELQHSLSPMRRIGRRLGRSDGDEQA
jgi:hypothetical protein